MTPEFRPWSKIARLNRDIIITEKIDGTNAAVGVTPEGVVYAQSRTRIITPESDNFGFAAWVHNWADALRDVLGPGIHFGEWWGSGIQRGYGLPKGEKRFSLFNVSKWRSVEPPLYCVPVLYEGPFCDLAVQHALADLRVHGSYASPFMDPEGIVVFHTASGTMFKVTLVGDEKGKGDQ